MKRDITGDLAVLCAVRNENGITAPMSLGEIADCIGCSKQSVHRLERSAMQKVKARLIESFGVDYVDFEAYV